MLIIRLQRTGRENLPTYRLVVAEKARPVKGKILEILGHYLPAQKPSVFQFKEDRISFWMKRGAALSDTTARLLKNSGMKEAEKYVKTYTKKKPRKAQAEAAPAPAEAATEKPTT